MTDEPPSTPDCGKDPIESIAAMFTSGMAGARPVFGHTHGVAVGTFSVRPGLPKELRLGVFAGSSYPVCVRFSSDTSPRRPDPRATCGIGIKLFGVPGPKLLAPDTAATTHDFVLQNHDVFFVDTALDMCEFTYAGVVKHDYPGYLRDHPKTKQILDDMQKHVESVLTSTYWSGLPSSFGLSRHVKYKLEPAGTAPEPASKEAAGDERTRLHSDLRRRLLGGAARFHFYVQFQKDAESMPLDAATVRWDEAASPPVHVATLTLASQDIDAAGQPQFGENLAFNSWHALVEHAPAGSIADARKVAYKRSADIRREHNHAPLPEPDKPPELERTPQDTQIVRAAIHPAIGVARVGNSQDEYFLGPELVRPPAAPADSFKDAAGAMKRQAARFRVYGYNAAGEPVAELTAADAEVEWTVHVANTKAAWYEFQLALDIPEAEFPDVRPSVRRNATLKGAARDGLAIDPGPRTISGGDVSGGAEHQFDTGEFLGTPVYLGELRTDEAGRLIFLGGRGVSASSDGSPLKDFANNDNWHDDVSDGPVTARVVLDGRPLAVDPAWVVTAPPNYAPDLQTIRTMHDLLYDVFVDAGWLQSPSEVSFAEHVYPLFERLTGLQWVNHAFATKFGWAGREHLLDPGYLSRLASGSREHMELREQIWTAFREWRRDGKSPNPWPWIYGDSMNIPAVSERQHLAISPTQRRLLALWADGKFTNDPVVPPPGPATIEELPLAEQPEMLDRAALAFCLADAFHPGCEMTWPMRHLSMYAAPYRIRHRPDGEGEADYGDVLTPAIAVGPDGPLNAQGPGCISRWMAVPWQGDTASCLSGYGLGAGFGRCDPYLPTFWPARVPNDVLVDSDYRTVMDASLPIEERRAAFERRSSWLRFLGKNPSAHMNDMVGEFGKFGVIEARPGPGGDDFPETILVESEVGFEGSPPPERNTRLLHVPEARDPELAEQAVNAALDRVGAEPDDEITAGYFSNVDRFPPPESP